MTQRKTTFAAIIVLLTTTIDNASAATMADQREGLPAVAAQSIERFVVRLGNGDGTVGESIDLVATEDLTYQRILLVNDVDGDGKADLVLHGTKTLRILLGDGEGSFAEEALVGMPPNTNLVAPLQLDADRRGLAVMPSATTMTFHELTDEGFVQLDTKVNVRGRAQAIYPARLNDDGQTDFVIRSQSGSGATLTDIVSMHVSNEEGGYTSSELSLAPQLSSLAVVDLNVDQLSDLLVVSKAATRPQLYLGDQFSAINGGQDLSFLDGLRQIASGDFNKDGLEDIVIGYNSDELKIIAVRGEQDYGDAVSVKFDDQEITGVSQAAMVSQLWTADVNGDGVADIVARTSSYGTTDGCCTDNNPPYNAPNDPSDPSDPTHPTSSAGGCTVVAAAELVPLADLSLPSMLLVLLWASWRRRRQGWY